MITVTAYKWVPAFAQGHVRDLRVRWALNEAGLDYGVKLIAHGDRRAAENLALQPFGQVPAYYDDDVSLFESGAILLHIADGCDILMPPHPVDRVQVSAWAVAALNTLEPSIGQLGDIDIFHAGEDWVAARRPQVEDMVRVRLADLAAYLEGRDWLVAARFTAADLMMACVLRSLEHTDLVTGDPVLGPYLDRCLARPAFGQALAEQMAVFAENSPAG